MARSTPVQCPANDAPCFDPNCTVTLCLAQIRNQEEALNRRAQKMRADWVLAKDRREAAWRGLRELAEEQNAEREAAGEPLIHLPRGGEREELIDRMLASERQVDRVKRHLRAITEERAGRAVPPRRPRKPRRQAIVMEI
jgi:hypothetical protein